jgi:hypothetical protein
VRADERRLLRAIGPGTVSSTMVVSSVMNKGEGEV